MTTILETPRLLLREFVPEDVDALALVISDPVTMRHYPNPFDRPAVEQWIQRNRARYAKDGHGLWAMILKSTGELIGDCGLINQEVDGTIELEIGYHVRRDHWGHGYAIEAASACREYGFARYPVDKLISLIRPENAQSCRVAEKNGMTIWKETMRAGLKHYVYAIDRPRDA
jgi:[ribosomal protein S5]-alanine N-acetyltransferase